MNKDELKRTLTAELPAIFPRTKTGELLGLSHRTLSNLCSKGQGPGDDAFVRNGSKNVLVVRDKFLPWYIDRLQPFKAQEA